MSRARVFIYKLGKYRVAVIRCPRLKSCTQFCSTYYRYEKEVDIVVCSDEGGREVAINAVSEYLRIKNLIKKVRRGRATLSS